MKLKHLFATAFLGFGIISTATNAANYVVDTSGAHASINVKVKHLGYSWLTGRFNKFSGKFNYDSKNVAASKITIDIETSSYDSNHAKRDKHINAPDILNTAKFPTAKFVSTKIVDKGDNKLAVHGDLTIRGVTKAITIDAVKIGEGKDPWGGYRVGFSGTAKITMKDFGIPIELGPASTEAYFDLHIEGVRQ